MGRVGQVGQVGRTVTRLRACVLVALVIALVQSSALRADDALDQGARLSALAKVWGLLKYFHPLVADGTVNWDLVLVDELPRIQAAESKGAFNDEIVRLIRSAGSAPRVTAGAPV